jgi:hypothetical protein
MKVKTRKQRRRALDTLIIQLEDIAYTEYDYLYNIPATPPNRERYIEAEYTFKVMYEL